MPLLPVFQRYNARLSYPVALQARFFNGGVLFDPVIQMVQIWKNAERSYDGGVMVDVIMPPHIIRLGIGQYEVEWVPLREPGTSPAISPEQDGPGSPGQNPEDPATITANSLYYDKWIYAPSPGAAEVSSFGLQFYLYPDYLFVDANYNTYRYELKQDRKIIVHRENLDIRLRIIPFPLYRDTRTPIVDYILPISQMQVRVVDEYNEEVICWATIPFTGKEGIFPTEALARHRRGLFYLQARLTLPNSQEIVFRKIAVQVED